MTTTPRLGAPELASGQAVPETTVNQQCRTVEQGASLFPVKDKDLATPPGSPTDGDAYIVAASPTGAWTGHAKSIAFYLSSAWVFIAPTEGMFFYAQDEDALYFYDGSAWGAYTAPSGGLSLASTVALTGTPATNSVGYLGAPQNIVSGAYTTVMTDAGKHFYHTSGTAHTVTIDSNANVAYPIGTILTFINENGGGVVTIAITSDTLRWGSSTGSRSLAANGTATAIKVASTTWRLTGDGIT